MQLDAGKMQWGWMRRNHFISSYIGSEVDYVTMRSGFWQKWQPFFSQITNLPQPYSTNCSREKLFLFRNSQYNYTEPACMIQCMSRFLIKRCGCRPIDYPGKTNWHLREATIRSVDIFSSIWIELSRNYQIKRPNLKYSFPRQRSTKWLP